ncbi:MAG TPA: YciI family protein [Alphaproteobacteria bacterium]|nr:YciI family protein [Alphaproteobacteria bacterium]
MLFAIITEDKPGSRDLRAATRPTHLEYLQSSGTRVVVAGPLVGPDGETMTGSLLIVDVADRAAAESFAAGDPYAKAGLFAKTTISAWRKVVFNPPAS